jgi:hypothetical protein
VWFPLDPLCVRAHAIVTASLWVHRPTQAAKRAELERELEQLEDEKRKTEELLQLRGDQFQLLMHSILDFQRTVEESM